MPNPRKRPDQRTGKAGTTKDFGVLARRSIEPAPTEIPACPASLGGDKPLASTVEAWGRLWGSDVAQVLDLRSDMESVVRWVSLIDERERVFRVYRKQRIVEGSQGQPTLSPLWAVVRSCDSELRALEDRIGLTPKARLQLGITFAEAGKSLDELNRLLDLDGDDADEDPGEDPRLRAIDTSAS